MTDIPKLHYRYTTLEITIHGPWSVNLEMGLKMSQVGEIPSTQAILHDFFVVIIHSQAGREW